MVILAVYVLGGDNRSIDTEEVAVKAHDLAPGMFSWQKYPEQINLELVRVTLSDAKKPKYGSLLQGSGREGWRLSSKGLNWASNQGRELLEAGLKWDRGDRKVGSAEITRKRREKTRLLSSRAWLDWSNGELPSVKDARDLFRIDEYSTKKMLEIKIVRLQSLFENDEKVHPFLQQMGDLVLETSE